MIPQHEGEFSRWRAIQPAFLLTNAACETAKRCCVVSDSLLNVEVSDEGEQPRVRFREFWATTAVGS